MDAGLIVSSIAVALLAVLLIKSFFSGGDAVGPQLLDMKNELADIRNRQLEAQAQALRQQQELFTGSQNALTQSQKVLTDQLGSIMKLVNENLMKTQENITSQLGNTGKVVGDIQRKLGTLEVTARNIEEIGKDITSLQDLLKAPKLRGNLGEYLLEDLLRQIFPAHNFEIKYSFKNGTQVDAVIKLGDGIVPVDSKFPLESFQRLVGVADEEQKRQYRKEFVKSVKDRIDEIAKKYINPDEGTYDFAMMYIPAENVFYETIINDSLSNKEYEIFNYAIQKRVIPVSPNSFYAYLMALAYGLKGFRIEQQAKVIIGELGRVQESFRNFYSDFTLVGKHIKNAAASYENSAKRAERLNDRMGKVTGVNMELGANGTGLLEEK